MINFTTLFLQVSGRGAFGDRTLASLTLARGEVP